MPKWVKFGIIGTVLVVLSVTWLIGEDKAKSEVIEGSLGVAVPITELEIPASNIKNYPALPNMTIKATIITVYHKEDPNEKIKLAEALAIQGSMTFCAGTSIPRDQRYCVSCWRGWKALTKGQFIRNLRAKTAGRMTVETKKITWPKGDLYCPQTLPRQTCMNNLTNGAIFVYHKWEPEPQACSNQQELDLALTSYKNKLEVGESATWQVDNEKVEFEKTGEGEFRCSKPPEEAVKIMLSTHLRITSFSEPNNIKIRFPACSSGEIDRCDWPEGCIAHPKWSLDPNGTLLYKGRELEYEDKGGNSADLTFEQHWCEQHQCFEPHDPPIMSDCWHPPDNYCERKPK